MFFDETVWEIVAALLLSIAGGLARQFYDEDKKPKRLKTRDKFIKELFIAFFSGIMGLVTILYMFEHVNVYGLYLFCGVCGWTSPNILWFITRVSEVMTGAEKGELSGKKE